MGSYGYSAQFEKYGVGIGLKTPDDIATIPAKLSEQCDAVSANRWWQEIVPDRFKELVEAKSQHVPMPAV
jgi:hypothetical protein